jgi:hypothetical protein
VGFIKCSVICVLPLIALILCRKYWDFIDSFIEQVGAFAAFLRHMERRISGYLTPPSSLGEGFSHPLLSKMVERLARGDSLIEAYRAIDVSIPLWADEILSELFLDFGKGDAALETRRIQDAASRLEDALAKERENGERQKKICSAVAPALALGIVILLI